MLFFKGKWWKVLQKMCNLKKKNFLTQNAIGQNEEYIEKIFNKNLVLRNKSARKADTYLKTTLGRVDS